MNNHPETPPALSATDAASALPTTTEDVGGASQTGTPSDHSKNGQECTRVTTWMGAEVLAYDKETIRSFSLDFEQTNKRLTELALRIKEQQIKEGLITLGWTPPDAPHITSNGLKTFVRPIRRHKLNAELVWCETATGNQWMQASDVVNLNLDSVPWD